MRASQYHGNPGESHLHDVLKISDIVMEIQVDEGMLSQHSNYPGRPCWFSGFNPPVPGGPLMIRFPFVFTLLLSVLVLVGCTSSGSEDRDGSLWDCACLDVGENIEDLVELKDSTPGLDTFPDDGLVLTDTGEDVTESDSDSSIWTDTDTGGEVIEPGEDLVICGELPQSSTEFCTVLEGNSSLLIRGTILGADKIYQGGEVLIGTNGRIICVGCDCSSSPEADLATVVTCPSGVVSPGIINAHDHLTFDQNHPANWGDERYEHRHDWRKGLRDHHKITGVSGGASTEEITWAEMRQVLGGATSIAGSGSANGFLRNLDTSALEGAGTGIVEYDTFPLGDSDGTLLSNSCNYPSLVSKSALNNSCYLPHVSEGIDKEARNEFLCLSSDANGGVDITESNAAFVHCIGMTAVDGAELASAGTAVVWSPRSNVALYGNTAPVTMYHNQGVLITMGTDWTASGSVNMLRELACADSLNQNQYDGFFTDKQLWEMVTVNAAAALEVGEALGSLKAGLLADVTIFVGTGKANPYRAVIEAGAKDVFLVLRGGLPLYGDLGLMLQLPDGQVGCEEIPGGVCGRDRAVCTQREAGKSFAQLKSANSSAYGLFFCGIPDDEPTCIPFRGGEYDGPVAGDMDGDGIEDTADNCPGIFNPIRPVDMGNQADFDGDGVGDLCDPCPINPGVEDCTPPDPSDPDADGIPTSDDNCPQVPNPDQADGDDDGIGNLCDPCAEYPNPGNSACPVEIYDIKDGTASVGNQVMVEGVVTAVPPAGFFFQVPEAEHRAGLLYRRSGIYAFIPAANPSAVLIPKLGDRVRVTGQIYDYKGQIELSYVSKVEVLAANQALPLPVAVAAQAVGTEGGQIGADGQDYESVLISVTGAEVTQLEPTPGEGDSAPTNEYVLDGALRVNDMMYLTDPMPQVGDLMDVTGILHWANKVMKLEPRFEDDLSSELKLKSLSPDLVFVQASNVSASAVPQLLVYLNKPATEPVSVTVSSSAIARLEVTSPVVIPAGQVSAEVKLKGKQGSEVPVVVTASWNGVQVSADVVVVDGTMMPAPYQVSPDPINLSTGLSGQVTITLDFPSFTGGVAVQLDDGNGQVFSAPSLVTVPQGQVQALVELQGIAAGSGQLTLTTSGGSLVVPVTVSDPSALGLVLTEVFYDKTGDDDGYEWVELFNGTSAPVNLSGWSLGLGGEDYTVTRYQLQGTIPAGGCFVVGGPQASSDNGNPVFGQAQDFNPDIQNSGSTADGVALFNLQASAITAGSVPVDAVIYGGSNGNNLKDESGQVGEVDVGDADAGKSIIRTSTGWEKSTTPTPGDCSHAL